MRSWLLSLWETPTYPDHIEKMAEALRTSALSVDDISSRSISEIGVLVGGKELRISWYPPFLGGERFRSLSYGGRQTLGNSLHEQYLFRTALARARRRFEEIASGLAQESPDAEG
jgi:hypothetical protein